PATAVGVPALHSPVFGAVEVGTPSALPQAPGTEPPSTGAEHCADAPPAPPKQGHVHGPVPFTLMLMPALHRPIDGGVGVATPLAGPQAPAYWQPPALHSPFGPAVQAVPSGLGA